MANPLVKSGQNMSMDERLRSPALYIYLKKKSVTSFESSIFQMHADIKYRHNTYCFGVDRVFQGSVFRKKFPGCAIPT